MMRKKLSAIIVGGGIGGLTAANALVRNGVSVTILEKAPTFHYHAGAGFGLSPNGQIVLNEIGIKAHEFGNPLLRQLLLNRDSTPIAETSGLHDIAKKYGYGVNSTLRSEVLNALLKPLQEKVVKFSHEVSSLQQSDHGVTVTTTNGEQFTADFLVGADGIHSYVAKAAGLSVKEPVYSGYCIFYGVINKGLRSVEAFEAPDLLTQTFDRGEFLSFYCGNVEPKPLVWALTYASNQPPNRAEWGSAKTLTELQQHLGRYAASHPIHIAAQHTPPDRLLHFGMYYREQLKSWHSGRVVLLGDSCHATLPFIGQGANMAIEDGYVLAQCIQAMQASSSSDFEGAFKKYYDMRHRRTEKIVKSANMLGSLYHVHNPVLSWCRDKLLIFLLKSGVLFKAAEKEIVEGCPVDKELWMR